MEVTQQRINDFIKANLRRDPINDRQVQQEELLLQSYGACASSEDLYETITKIPNLDPNKIKALLNEKFYSYDTMKSIACVLESIYYQNTSSVLQSNDTVKEHLINPKRIGDESTNGVALTVDLHIEESKNDGEDIFIMKAPLDAVADQSIAHEAFVGLYALNQLRREIPNFAYIFGTFLCTKPLLTDGSVVDWCASKRRSKGSYRYVLYENISNSVTMSEFCKTCTAEEWMNQYIQAMCAFRLAQYRYQFTHYDAHGDNILIRRAFGGLVYIPFKTDKGIQYLLTDGRIATIIDYDKAYIVVENRPFGCIESFPQYNIFNDKSNKFIDAYKLLMYCLATMQYYNKEVYDTLINLVAFFAKENYNELVVSNEENYFTFPFNDEDYPDIDLNAWIDFCRQFCTSFNMKDPITMEKPTDHPILGCPTENVGEAKVEGNVEGDARFSAENCPSQQEQLQELILKTPTPTPNTVKQFIRAHDSFLKISSKKATVAERKEYEPTIQEFVEKTRANLNAIYQYEKEILDAITEDLSLDQVYILKNKGNIFVQEVLLGAKKFVLEASTFMSTFKELITFQNILLHFAKTLKLPRNDRFFVLAAQARILHDEKLALFNDVRKAIVADVQWIKRHPWRDTVFRNRSLEPYRWYWIAYPSIVI